MSALVGRLRAIRSVPLRVKLVASVLALVAAALVVISVGSAYFLRTYLTSRVDGELLGYLDGVPAVFPEPSPDGLPSDYMISFANGDKASIYYYEKRYKKTDLPGTLGSQAWYASRAGDGPFTVSAGGKGGPRWRVVVAQTTPAHYVAVAQSLSDVDYAVGRLVWIDISAGGGVLVVLAAAGAAIVRRSLRPLNEIELTAAAIADGDLSQRVPDPEPGVTEAKSELGRLSRALNTMLAQIESAFAAREASESAARDAALAARLSETRALRSEERMRQFVADASHELRTPLTTIRGFAELYRQVSAAAADEGESRIVRRIEDEAARMGLLVEDLLLLARLDEERPLTLAPVDLRVLAADALHAARVAAPERDIQLTVAPGTGPLVVEGDDPRLRQVLGNLIANAVNHTPPSATVRLRLAADTGRADARWVDATEAQTPKAYAVGAQPSGSGAAGSGVVGTGVVGAHTPGTDVVWAHAAGTGMAGADVAGMEVGAYAVGTSAGWADATTAVVEVSDTGPGLEAGQAEHVFERFYRADPSRTRRDGSTSTGLGLSIVAALVAAHAGSVEVESVPGRGATFRVRLPLRQATAAP